MIHKHLLKNMTLYYNNYEKKISHNLLFLAIQLFIYILKKRGKKARESKSIDLDHRTTVWWIYVLNLLLHRPIKLLVTILTPLVESGIITFTINI
jgi:hypothetical protein